jgi:hypothetical protein
MAKTDLQPFEPQHSLDFYVEARDGRKRNYIFDYGKARTCDHPEMKIIARGGNMYRCTECNYVHQWPGAITWPLHFTVIQGAFQILHFAKEYGTDALQEVLRRPIGQSDDTPHKPVLPEGMSFADTIAALQEVDVNAPDGGQGQLTKLIAEFWEAPNGKSLSDGGIPTPRGLGDGDSNDSGNTDAQ